MHQLPVVALAGVLAAYLAVWLPFAGMLQRRELERRWHAGSPERLALYRRLIAHHWQLAGASVAVGCLTGVPSALWRPPPAHRGVHVEALLVVALAAAPLTALLTRTGSHRPPQRSLLPTTRSERQLFAAAALTAGVTEELLFRGFLLLCLNEIAGLPWTWAAGASAAAFGLNHLCQGPAVALGAVAAGLVLTGLYAVSGSLLLPIALHVAIDLRVLLRRGSPVRETGQECSGSSAVSMRSPSWKTIGAPVSTPSPATTSSVGAVADAW